MPSVNTTYIVPFSVNVCASAFSYFFPSLLVCIFSPVISISGFIFALTFTFPFVHVFLSITFPSTVYVNTISPAVKFAMLPVVCSAVTSAVCPFSVLAITFILYFFPCIKSPYVYSESSVLVSFNSYLSSSSPFI